MQTAREAFFAAIPSGAASAVHVVLDIVSVILLEEFEGDLLCENPRRRRDGGLTSQFSGG